MHSYYKTVKAHKNSPASSSKRRKDDHYLEHVCRYKKFMMERNLCHDKIKKFKTVQNPLGFLRKLPFEIYENEDQCLCCNNRHNLEPREACCHLVPKSKYIRSGHKIHDELICLNIWLCPNHSEAFDRTPISEIYRGYDVYDAVDGIECDIRFYDHFE